MDSRLYIRNIPPSISLGTLEDMFNAVGDVESSDFIDPVDGSPLRAAYVKMASEQAALDCIQRFNGTVLEGSRLVVTSDQPHVPDPRFKSSTKKGSKGLKAKKASPKKRKS